MNTTLPHPNQTRQILHSLGFSAHHTGYQMLHSAITLYFQDSTRCLTKEIYPTLAKQFGYCNPGSVEHPIRYAIAEARAHGDPQAWNTYFPGTQKAPSNHAFIAAMAECLK